jgi:hypothetical protein
VTPAVPKKHPTLTPLCDDTRTQKKMVAKLPVGTWYCNGRWGCCPTMPRFFLFAFEHNFSSGAMCSFSRKNTNTCNGLKNSSSLLRVFAITILQIFWEGWGWRVKKSTVFTVVHPPPTKLLHWYPQKTCCCYLHHQ